MLIYPSTRKIKVGISKKLYFLDLTVAQTVHKSELLYAIYMHDTIKVQFLKKSFYKRENDGIGH